VIEVHYALGKIMSMCLSFFACGQKQIQCLKFFFLFFLEFQRMDKVQHLINAGS
jgi:hypothetical protein